MNKIRTFHQSIDYKIDERLQKRQSILLPQNNGVTSMDLCYDKNGNLEFIDIRYKKDIL